MISVFLDTNILFSRSTDFTIAGFLSNAESLIGEIEVNDIYDKVQYKWVIDVENEGERYIISIYDWKEYSHFSKYENIEWHIGANGGWNNASLAKKVREYILNKIDDIVREI